jgi:hypothetical protein
VADALELRRRVSLARLLLVLYAPDTPERVRAAEALAEVLQKLTLEADE